MAEKQRDPQIWGLTLPLAIHALRSTTENDKGRGASSKANIYNEVDLIPS